MLHAPAAAAVNEAEVAAPENPIWLDVWTALGDRRKEPPLPLPPLHGKPQHDVFIVRHGESTWNAASRVQGSSDASVLTQKGIAQANATADMVRA
jgi:hypothetical protein